MTEEISISRVGTPQALITGQHCVVWRGKAPASESGHNTRRADGLPPAAGGQKTVPTKTRARRAGQIHGAPFTPLRKPPRWPVNIKSATPADSRIKRAASKLSGRVRRTRT